MRVVADLHIHSPFSRAVSKEMSFRNIEKGALTKGLDVVGTGDITHPRWREMIREELAEEDGLYRLKDGKIRFILTGEVCTTFELEGKSRRIHHLIVLPSLEAADQLCEVLSKRGDLASDGRPNLNMTGAEFAEEVVELGERCLVVPAHIWTPWFSLFGSRGGVDSIEDCYEDMTPHIYAIETGLSSDPPMNWRIRALDRMTLISNSDSHSPSPLRIGREANIIELGRLDYDSIVDVVMHRKKDIMTVEVDPSYGKYHWTGHRACGVVVKPADAITMKGICPVCGKRMTKGVAERVEELADREEGVVPEGAQDYVKILPLSELISAVMNRDAFFGEVQRRYWEIMKKFSNEMEVLLKAPHDVLVDACGGELADMILMCRQGRMQISPGYDGVYGKLLYRSLASKI
ncbi:MAG: endonuclease Q family protein [Candidatus Methanomethylicia archaeon]|nr:endonuclease Q family protein [Candidatus Methanomethylicia archaeon]